MPKNVIIMGAAGRDFHNFNVYFRNNSNYRDVVLIGTPVDLRRVLKLAKQTVRVKYDLQVLGPVCLEEVLDDFLKSRVKK